MRSDDIFKTYILGNKTLKFSSLFKLPWKHLRIVNNTDQCTSICLTWNNGHLKLMTRLLLQKKNVLVSERCVDNLHCVCVIQFDLILTLKLYCNQKAQVWWWREIKQKLRCCVNAPCRHQYRRYLPLLHEVFQQSGPCQMNQLPLSFPLWT